MIEFLKFAASAFLGMLAGFAVQWTKTGRDELRQLCDEFRKVSSDAADLASQHWLESGDGSNCPLQQARLIGSQHKLEGLRVLVGSHFEQIDQTKLAEHMALFFDALTGGPFGQRSRKPQPHLAQLVQKNAADLILCIRRAYANQVSFWRTTIRWARWFFPFQ